MLETSINGYNYAVGEVIEQNRLFDLEISNKNAIRLTQSIATTLLKRNLRNVGMRFMHKVANYNEWIGIITEVGPGYARILWQSQPGSYFESMIQHKTTRN